MTTSELFPVRPRDTKTIYDFVNSYIQLWNWIPGFAEQFRDWHLRPRFTTDHILHTRFNHTWYVQYPHIASTELFINKHKIDFQTSSVKQIPRFELFTRSMDILEMCRSLSKNIYSPIGNWGLKKTRRTFCNRLFLPWIYWHVPEVYAHMLIAMYHTSIELNGCWKILECNNGIIQYPPVDTKYKNCEHPIIYMFLGHRKRDMRRFYVHHIAMIHKCEGHYLGVKKPIDGSRNKCLIRHKLCNDKTCFKNIHIRWGSFEDNMRDVRMFNDPFTVKPAGNKNRKKKSKSPEIDRDIPWIDTGNTYLDRMRNQQ